MSYRSHVVAPSRVFDHLYDPTFTTSSPKNLYRENCIALTRSAPIHVHPSDNSMFSELTHEPRNFYVYQRNALPHLPSIATNEIENTVKSIPTVTGADRSKFFATPSCNMRTINVGLMQSQTMTRIEIENSMLYSKSATKVDGEMKSKSTCIQTVYRESSAQTRPWLPEITCFAENEDDDDVPEVVYIADLIDSTVTYPGLREVEIVERARKRRMWENALPPITSPDDIPARAAALEAFEWEEWIAREKEINECQQARLKIVADLIAKREKKHLSETNQKLENCKKRIIDERKHKKDILIRNYQRSMRKLDLAKRRSLNREKLKDPVLSHYDKKMEYSFPKIRLDAFSKKKTTQFEYSNDFQTKFKLIEEENSPSSDLQEYLKDNKRQLWRPKEPPKEVERGIWNENYLKKLHETLKQFRQKKYAKRKTPKCMIFEDAKPQTSSVTAEHSSTKSRLIRKSVSHSSVDSTDEIYQNLVHIQKNIKGRAIQSLLTRGVKRFRDVIEEAKETHSIAAIRKLFPPEFVQHIDNHEHILDEYKRIEDALKNDVKLQEELRKVESRDAGNLLNFLEHELRRLDGEKRSHALYLLAERERCCRQATSMGKSEFDEQFKNDGITLYLENVLMEGIQRATATSEEETRDYVRKVARKIDRKASKNVTFHDETEEFSCESNTESVTNDDSTTEINEIPDQNVVMKMLKDGMMPQILNRIKSEQMATKQKKFLSAAHQVLFRDEFEQLKIAEYREICVGVFDEIVDSAIIGERRSTRSASMESDNSSKVADQLAGEIVQNILSEMIDSNFQFSSTGESSFSGDSYDGDYSNFQSTDGDSTAEFLANQVVQNVLDEIMELSFTSTSTSSAHSACASGDMN